MNDQVKAGRLSDVRESLAAKRYRQAHALCMAAIAEDPSDGEPLYLLGLLAADHDNHAKALELYDRAERSGFAASELHAQAARSALALSRREDAVTRVRRAMEAGPSDATTLDTIGVVLSRAGLHGESIPFYERTTSAAPSDAGFHYNLGAALQFAGDFDGARKAFDACLAIDPQDTRARVAKVSIARQTEDANDLDALLSAWDARNQSDNDSVLQLAHAIAKTHEDLGRPGDAMEWLARGKSQKAAHLVDRRAADRAVFKASRALASAVKVSRDTLPGGPVFITGMPRTGTTLVDRILTSHPEMTSAGELSDFSVLLKRELKTPGAHVLDGPTLEAAQRNDLSAVGEAYLARVRKALGLAGRFTDKMPLNIFFAPAILSAIPSARVICLRRHPADTTLSNYRQLFATAFSYYAYAYSLEQTAEYVVAFNALISDFERMLPPQRFRIINYEGILDDQEGQTRALLEFCDLDFDAACLRFHENAAPVATASSAQVREPLYQGSRGRWKRYRPAIDPALDILDAAGLMGTDDWRAG